MTIAATPAVERIARVLAALHHSRNGEGDEARAGAIVDQCWHAHVDTALAVLHTLREPDEAMAAAGDAEVWRGMVNAALARPEAAFESAGHRSPRADQINPLAPSVNISAGS